MISNSSKYAIKAVLHIAAYASEEKKIMVKDIAKPINVPKAYVAKLLQELSRQHIISSLRGPKGGFYLTKDNKRKSIMNIIEVIEGDLNNDSCLLSLHNCNPKKPCPLHSSIHPIKRNLMQVFKEKTIEDMSNEVKSGQVFLLD
tara:strand:+ start:3798 stop:4229 length:432 start_codon:yes stop_codon:yes gene_type:complete